VTAGSEHWGNSRRQWRSKSFIGGGRKSVRSSLFVGAMVAARYQSAAQKLPRQTRRRRQAGDQGPGDCLSHAGHGSEKILFLTRADRKVIYLLPNGSGGWKGLSDLGQTLLGNQARVPLADNGAIHRITIVLG
jgi:hypothetical protein